MVSSNIPSRALTSDLQSTVRTDVDMKRVRKLNENRWKLIIDSLNPFEDDGSSDCENVSGTSTDSSQLSEDFVVSEHGDNELILVAKGEVSAKSH